MSNENDTPETSDLPGGASSPEWLRERVAEVRLTPKGELVARFLAANPRAASVESASELAERIGVNVATVVRFAQTLGFSGWPEFQLHFRHRYLGSLLPTDVLRSHRQGEGTSHLEAAIRRDIENLQAALTSVTSDAVEQAARAIFDARRTVVAASGSFAAVGQVLAHLSAVMGLPVALETRGGVSTVATCAALETGDCLVAISFWRQMRDVSRAARDARARGAKVVAITDSVFSPLAEIADTTLIVPTESASFFQSLTAPLSVVYALLAQLEELGGDDAETTIARVQGVWADLDLFHPYDTN